MRATVMHGAGDVRVETLPGPTLVASRDAAVPMVPELLAVLDGTIDPGRAFDRTVALEDTPSGYAAMDAREALKVLVKP